MTPRSMIAQAKKAGGTLAGIAAYNKAFSQLWGGLSEEKRNEFNAKGARWTAEGPDPADKLQYVFCSLT